MGSFSCLLLSVTYVFFFFQAEDGIRYYKVTGVQTCALPIFGVEHRTTADHVARSIIGGWSTGIIRRLIDDSAAGCGDEALVANYRAVRGIRVHDHIECDGCDISLAVGRVRRHRTRRRIGRR